MQYDSPSLEGINSLEHNKISFLDRTTINIYSQVELITSSG
ncbi:MAG TPA: hypothetical protein VIS96_17880 [Terrimicrobiaceae bacterium]